MPNAPRTPKKPRIVTMLTDFGSQDHFVGVMKGVIHGIAENVRVVDLSHEIEPFQIAQARFLLAQSWRWFPKGTVHLAVIDPGVGSERRPLVVEAGGHLFVGPDNGLFTELISMDTAKVRQITNRKWMNQPVSATFHGRDIFAPAAARLAAGARPSLAGPLLNDAIRLTTGTVIRTGKRFWTGEIVQIDRFGNAITNLTPEAVPDLAVRPAVFRVGFREIAGLTQNYASGAAGEVVALIGSHGGVEFAVNQGHAAKALGVGLGAPVELEIV